MSIIADRTWKTWVSLPILLLAIGLLIEMLRKRQDMQSARSALLIISALLLLALGSELPTSFLSVLQIVLAFMLGLVICSFQHQRIVKQERAE